MSALRLALDWKRPLDRQGVPEGYHEAVDGTRQYRIRKETVGDKTLFLLALYDFSYPTGFSIAAKALPGLNRAKVLAETWRGMDIVWNETKRDFELVDHE